MDTSNTALKRRIGPVLLIFYGVGVMVGAGIYVLTGTIAGEAGVWAPVAFLLAGLIAGPTALSYGELSARIPESGGEAAYVREALGAEWPAVVIGLLIVSAGTVSAGAVLQGGVGYLTGLVEIDRTLLIVVIGSMLTLIAVLGVIGSLRFVAILTLIEIAGLVLIIAVGIAPVSEPVVLGDHSFDMRAVAFGASLAFFAFIGFEDMVNLAEETVNPGRTMPKAIIWALAITTLLYALVAFVSVRVVAPVQLASSYQPLALVFETATGRPAWFLSLVAVMAALNGVLAQIIMASRVLFGLARRITYLRVFGQVSETRGTPVVASVLIGGLVILAALTLDLQTLAETTSMLLLFVFCVMNAALLILKSQDRPAPEFEVHRLVPVAGLILSGLALVIALFGS